MATNGHTNGYTNGHTNGNSSSALCSVQEFSSQDYDYVIVGGGTAGLCVAARLTENPDVKVGVIEAGADRMDVREPHALSSLHLCTLNLTLSRKGPSSIYSKLVSDFDRTREVRLVFPE